MYKVKLLFAATTKKQDLAVINNANNASIIMLSKKDSQSVITFILKCS